MQHSRTSRAAFGVSIFTEISALAAQHGAVDLGQGFPDFAAPEFIKQAACDALLADRNQYAPGPGVPELRQAVARDWERQHGQPLDWRAEVTVTSGATEALYAAALALLQPGDRAVVFVPAFDVYIPDIRLAGAEPLAVHLHPPDWRIDWDQLEAAFRQRPRLIIVNTPNNPTGKVFSRDELERIAGLCQEYDVLAIADEVYGHLVYDGAAHISLATLPGMWERSLTIYSIGKSFSVTGWKIGYAVGPAWLNQALRDVHQWVTFATATPLQHAAAQALDQAADSGYYQSLRAMYAERRRQLAQILDACGLPVLPNQGAYFALTDISASGLASDQEFCRMLIRDIGVAAIPISAFYPEPDSAPKLARFCFAKQPATLQQAAERLARLGDLLRRA